MARTVIMVTLDQHKSVSERKTLQAQGVREMISEIAMLMCYEATRELPLTDVE